MFINGSIAFCGKSTATAIGISFTHITIILQPRSYVKDLFSNIWPNSWRYGIITTIAVVLISLIVQSTKSNLLIPCSLDHSWCWIAINDLNQLVITYWTVIHASSISEKCTQFINLWYKFKLFIFCKPHWQRISILCYFRNLVPVLFRFKDYEVTLFGGYSKTSIWE